jgi:hypothetical protein
MYQTRTTCSFNSALSNYLVKFVKIYFFNLGSSDQEKRQTRSKLKTLIEMPASEILPSTSQASLSTPATSLTAAAASARVVTRRHSKKQLEQVTEETNSSQPSVAAEATSETTTSHLMSISNLRKHDAIMERLKAEQQNDNFQEMSQQVAGTATLPRKGRATRSRATRSPSPTASSVVSVSSVLTVASTSTVTSSAVGKRRGSQAAASAATATTAPAPASVTRSASTRTIKKSNSIDSKSTAQHDKTLKAEDVDSVVCLDSEEASVKAHYSPTSSVVSLASSVTSGTRTLRRNRKVKEDLDLAGAVDLASNDAVERPASATLARSNSDRKYSLRSKGSSKHDNDDTSSVVSSVASEVEEIPASRGAVTSRTTSRAKPIKTIVEEIDTSSQQNQQQQQATRQSSKRSSSKSK